MPSTQPRKRKDFFITGTDTDIGKTFVAVGLLNWLHEQGFSTLGYKPVACGGIQTAHGIRNEDALLLQKTASIKLPYESVNPIMLAPPLAPHIAAEQSNVELTVAKLMQSYEAMSEHAADYMLIEGAGGWLVPLNHSETMADFVSAAQLSCIMVVGMRLGCLNHALLTYRAIKAQGVNMVGWIANCIDPVMPEREANIDFLVEQFSAPLLGAVPYGGYAAEYLDMTGL